MRRFHLEHARRGALLRARRRIGASCLVGMLAVLCGCGQKGPLLLPGDAAAREAAASASSIGAGEERSADDDDETESRGDGL